MTKKNYDMSTLIKKEVNQEVARILKGKAHSFGAELDKKDKQQYVNFVHTNEFAGNSLTHCSILSNSWILDTGETSHLCCDKSLFHNLDPFASLVSLFLPDGSSKLVHLDGNVIVKPSLTLYNILFTPNLKHNLISIHKIAY